MATPEPGQADARTLLELAIDVHTDLGKLATGLAHAGANPQIVAQFTRMADIIAEVAKVLGTGDVGSQGQAQPGGAPPEAQGQGAGAPPEAQAAPAPAQAGPPQGAMPGERPNGLHEATANLQAALASKHAAAQRALAQGQ